MTDVRQRSSHQALLDDVSMISALPRASSGGLLDAVVVPSARTAGSLGTALELAAEVGTRLVVLSSGDSRVDEIAERAMRVPGSKVMVADVPADYTHPLLQFRTSKEESFQKASAERRSDLSTKRNLGLLLARMLGWQKVLFLDDDVEGLGRSDIARLSHQLDRHPAAGMVLESFPDNSVVCHANRLAGHRQDVFVSGAVLGVHCGGPPRFFPDIYNEDWFFLYHQLTVRRVPKVGIARQRAYDPYGDAQRAAREEFGDVLAEGLFGLLEDGDRLPAATRRYWRQFLAARQALLTGLTHRLSRFEHREAHQAIKSLDAARTQLDQLDAGLCTDYLVAWQEDLDGWLNALGGLPRVDRARDAMDHLQLCTWRVVEFARPDCELTPAASGRSSS